MISYQILSLKVVPGTNRNIHTEFILVVNILWAQPKIKFEKREHNFGDVVDGSFPSTIFKFTNTGDKNLVLQKVQSSCGCTSPSWPREPIPPGESGEVKVMFNTRGYKNKSFVKSVMIT